MRVVSYNIHKGVGNDRRYRLERIVGVLRETEADVVCLQEVDTNVRRCSFDDQPRLLAAALGDLGVHSLFQLNVKRGGGGYGNLVLSRWPVHTAHDVPLTFGRLRARAAQMAVVESPLGPVRLVNWHLGLLGSERRWQADQLLGRAWDRHPAGDLPAVVVGDTNDWRNTLHDRFATRDFHQATNPVRSFRSFPSFLPAMSLDKAFVRDLRADARVHRSPLAARASDHLPLVVDLQAG